MQLTPDQVDALIADCGDCWCGSGGLCRDENGHPVAPHPARMARARRRGAMGGVGRAQLHWGESANRSEPS